MKCLKLAAFALAISFAGSVFAQDTPPVTPTPNPVVNPAPATVKPPSGLKITKMTGTVTLMKDGLVVQTLKVGDTIPALADPSMTFVVSEGSSIEIQAGGETIVGNAGSNFTVSAPYGGAVQINVSEGTPVQINSSDGNNVVLAQNTQVSMNSDGAKVGIVVTEGSASVMTPSGTPTVYTKDSAPIEMPAAVQPPATQPQTPGVTNPAGTTPVEEPKTEPVVETPVVPPFVPEPPAPPTKEVTESCEVSSSSPDCK